MNERQRLPNRRRGEVFSFELAGQTYTATVSRFKDGRPAEIFLDAGKTGSGLQIAARDAAILASLLLQHGVGVNEIKHTLTKNPDGSGAGPIAKTLDLIVGAAI